MFGVVVDRLSLQSVGGRRTLMLSLPVCLPSRGCNAPVKAPSTFRVRLSPDSFSKHTLSSGRSYDVQIGLIQFCLSAPKTDMENNVVVSDYAAMDRILREERKYILGLCKKVNGCTVCRPAEYWEKRHA